MTQKKRNPKFFKEKKLIELRMKDHEINMAIRNQSLVELDEPIHHGYNAEWILRSDIEKREDAHVFQEALDACKKMIWGKTPEFRVKNSKTKRWENVKPGLKKINKAKYDALSPSAQKFFFETTKSAKYWRVGFNDKEYQCTLSYELVVKITKHYITHRREHDNILYQMDAENEKMLYKVAGNDNPWGAGKNYPKWYRKVENAKEKNRASRELVEVKKIYPSIKKKKDLLDL
jgi:hypothetical protein